MNCPNCSKGTHHVIRVTPYDAYVLRRRECSCGERFTTKEVITSDDALKKRENLRSKINKLGYINKLCLEQVEEILTIFDTDIKKEARNG